MRLTECYIENFGKLSNYKLSFSDGLNSIKKDNGYGKTTLSVFIKAMLYGLDDNKKQKIEDNNRKHYMPWQGGRCGGSLSFEASGKTYRIERTFMPRASEDTFKLYDCKSGRESYDFSDKIGEELFGIDADGFERTVFLSEANLSGKNENKTVSAKLSDLVGCDGDLSVMNEAIELLEKQRKVYYKRGGTGEIGDIKSKISDIERKINELIRMKSEYAKEEIRLSEISTELKLALEEKNRLIKASRLAEEARVRKAYINQYREMKLMLEKEENEKKELEKFFVNGVPVRDEIEEARELSIKASRLKDLSRGRDDDEYIKLREFFASELPDEEFERARAILSSLESKKKEAELVERDIVAIQYDEQKNCNDAKTAEHLIEELHLLKQQEKSNKKWLAYTFFGCTGIIASLILGILTSPILFSLSIVGIILSAIGIKSKPRTKAIKADEKLYERARSYIRGVGYSDGIPNDRLINRLREIQRGLQLTSATNERLTSLLARAEEINSQISELEARACQFISNFKVENRENTTSAINEILRKRDLFLALAKTKNNLIKQAEKESLLADEYRKSFQAFLSRFPTTTSRPFDEISSKLIEYEALFRSCEKMKISMADFAVKHGINSDMTEQTDTTESQLIQKSPEELDLKISALEREKTLVERKIADLGEEIDKIDELSSEKQELIERAELYEKKLGVILKTISFLGEAKDSLTSRYLSKTKSAFDKYISLIDGQSAANFQMNTSFSIMKNERGTLRGAEAYSRGTRDLYALAARLALIDSLYESEQPFIILDDPFAYFDDEKLSKSLSLISRLSEERQIIYLTCTSAREA